MIIQPPVIAHRGASAHAPENTLAAFLAAKKLGINWVEFDVMLSQDHEAVVIHDFDLKRTTNSSGLVSETSLSILKTLDAGSWFNSAFADQKIPTFKEVIALLNEHKLAANVEIKSQPGMGQLAVQKIMEIIQTNWAPDHIPPLISSFSLEITRAVRAYSATCSLGWLMDTWQSDWKKTCDELNCISVHVNQNILNADRVKQIKNAHKQLLCYTVDDPLRAKELFSWGVDAVFSNAPDSICSIL